MSSAGPRRRSKRGNKKLPRNANESNKTEDCGCDSYEESDDDFEFPAQLPWFKSEVSDLDAKIEDTKFFKHLMEFGKKETGKFNLQLYKILAYSFPYYLPLEFHTMDSRAYVDNLDASLEAASHFILTNYINGPFYYRKIEELCFDRNKEGHKLLMKSCLLNYLKRVGKNANLHLPESAMSAKDFILEPWIIIQLPFQPGLLHQWMVAALAEYCKFQNQVAEFRCLRFQNNVKEVVESIFNIGRQVLGAITCCLQVLRYLSTCGNATSCSTIFDHTIEEMFFHHIVGIIKHLPALEFMISTKFKNMICALKRMAWTGPRKSETRLFAAYFTALDTFDVFNFMYSLKFWKKGDLTNLFGVDFEVSHLMVMGKLSEMPLQEHLETEVSRDEIRSFIREEIIMTGRVTGVSTEEVMKSLGNSNNYFNFVHSYKQLRFYKESAKGIRLEDSGVMMNLINLQCQAQASTFRAALCDIIINANQHKTNVLYHSLNNEGPDFTITQIERANSKALSSKKWSVEYVINQVKKQCPKPETFQMPDVSTLGVEKVASIFEARMKHTVFRMLESQYGLIKKKEERKFYPELLLIQYLLPRFVGMMLFMDMESKSLGKTGENEELKRYAYFLHNLINCYDAGNCYKMVPRATIPKSFHGRLLHFSNASALKVKIEFTRDELAKLFPNTLSIAHEIYGCCIQILNTCNELPCTKEGVDFQIFEWNVHLYQFVTKVLYSLQLTSEHFGCLKTPNENLMVLKSWSLINVGQLAFNMGATKATKEDHLYPLMYIFRNKIYSFEDDCSSAACGTLYSRMNEEAKSLSKEQLTGLFVYLALNNICDQEKHLAKSAYLTFVPFDSLEIIFYAFVQGDRWRVKQRLSLWLTNRNTREDLSIVSLEFAKTYPALYGPVLQNLHTGWKWEKGEITFFPIKHCRWCGKVDCFVFRVCKECQDSEDYPDMNLFCSEKCEKEALMDIHLEEHARFVIEKCKF